MPDDTILLFADGGLFVVAGNVVPFDTISVEVIKDSNADFIAVTVVRLGFRSRLLATKNRTKIALKKALQHLLKTQHSPPK